MEKLTAALGRVDYLITYSLVTFVGEVIKRYFSSHDIVSIALVVTAICQGVEERMLLDSSVFKVTIDSMHRVGAILFVNSIMQTVHAASLSDTSMFVLVVSFIVSTGVVIIVPTVVKRAVDNRNDVASQISRLVFFMYAENSVLLTADTEVNRVMPALAIMVLCGLRGCRECASPVIQTLLQAFAMLATNVLVTTLVDSADTASDSATGIAWLVGFMIVLENIAARESSDVRDYALWKSSALISIMLAALPREGLIVCGGLLGCVSGLLHWITGASCETLTDLGVLLAANTFLDIVRINMQGVSPKLVWIVLLGFANIMHITLASFSHATQKNKK